MLAVVGPIGHLGNVAVYPAGLCKKHEGNSRHASILKLPVVESSCIRICINCDGGWVGRLYPAAPALQQNAKIMMHGFVWHRMSAAVSYETHTPV